MPRSLCAQSQALAERDATPENRLDYALLLMAAQRESGGRCRSSRRSRSDPESAPVALRLLGLIEFQEGKLDAAAQRDSPNCWRPASSSTMRFIIWV